MQRTWIIDLSESSPSKESNGFAIEAVLSGFTGAALGEPFCWWHYHEAGPSGWPGREGIGPLIDAIDAPSSSHAARLDSVSATVFLIGSADESATREGFFDWACGLASLEPADWLGAPGTVRRVGILRLPEDLFKVARATDEAFSAFLAQLNHAGGLFDSLYLVGDEASSRELGAVEVSEADRPYLLAQLILHCSAPEPSQEKLPSGICSAGVFALHADWQRFREYCQWKFSSDLWDKFMHSGDAPFFNPSELEMAAREGKLEPATRPGNWHAAFMAVIPREPDLPTERWSIPPELSPWRIWSSALLDRGGFFEGWLRHWAADLSRENSAMTAEVLEGATRRLDAQAKESESIVTSALRDDVDLLAGASYSARSRTQWEAFFLDSEKRLQDRTKDLHRSHSALFDFSSDRRIHEMLDKARKEVEAGGDQVSETAELKGLTARLQSHPSLLAMALRAALASALLVTLAPPGLALLRAWKPALWPLSGPPELWTAIAFLAPFAAMVLSVKYRHNYIGQHARKLTMLALARIEKQVSDLCAGRLESSFRKMTNEVVGARERFLEFCDRLVDHLSASEPSLSHPELPLTAFQRPLLGGDGSNVPTKATADLQVTSRDGHPVPFDSLREDDYAALLRRLVSFGAVAPSDLVPGLAQQEGGSPDEDPGVRILQFTRDFASRELTFTDEGHRRQWREACEGSGALCREVERRSAPSVERQQGYDISEGRYVRSSHGLELPGFEEDIHSLNGYASWMSFSRFPSLASAIPNPLTVQATREWLERGLHQEPETREEFHSPAAGRPTFEKEPWSRVAPGDLLATVGDYEVRSNTSGFVDFGEADNLIAEGQLVARVICFASDDPRLIALFELAERLNQTILDIGGSVVEGRLERVETYRFLARERREMEGRKS